MGVLTRYLELLPADARARVLNGRHWTTHWPVNEAGARNLLGHAEDWTFDATGVLHCNAPAVFRLRRAAGDDLWTDEPRISSHFERLVERRGMDVAVALIRAHLLRAPRARVLR